MKDNDGTRSEKGFSIKLFLRGFLLFVIYLTIVFIITNVIQGDKILDFTEIIAIIIASFIIESIGFLYKKYGK